VKVRKQARYVDEQACIGCAACIEPCPIRVPNEYNNGLDQRAAIYNPFRGALPNIPLIDTKSCLRFTTGEECTVCAQSCPFAAVKYDDADQVREFNVGAVVLATGAELFDLRQAPQYGYGVIPDVYTHLDLEYLLNTSGPTAGKVALRNGEPPQKIAILHCVGSRSEIFNRHCSGTCCLTSLKIAHLLKKQFPDASISELYTDFSLPDKKAQEFLRKLQNEDKIQFIRVPSMDHVRVESAGGKIALRGAELEKIGGAFSDFDMVVLSVGLVGGVDNRRLASLFDVACDEHSFIGQANSKLDPASTATQGINLAGCVEWPKNVDATVAQAQAAAGKILSRLVPGETLELDPCVAFVNEEACSGCKMCLSVCSYRAIDWKEQVSRAVVSGVLCKGCGVCAACCPSGAIESFHFTDKQILAEVQAFLASPLEDSVWIR
jgi:heterodisulfide reductase subunit A